MSTKAKKPTRKPSKLNTLTVDLDKTESLYRKDKDGGTIAIDPVDNRMTHLSESETRFIASRAALGIALGQVLLPADRANYAYAASMLDQTLPSCEPDTMHKAFAEVGKILSEIDEKRLQELQLRALEIITNSVLTKDIDSLFD